MVVFFVVVVVVFFVQSINLFATALGRTARISTPVPPHQTETHLLKQPHQPPPIWMPIRQSFRDGGQREVLLINFLCYFRFGKQSEHITLFALYALTPFFYALESMMW
jgi:hypothetical protein